MEVVVKVERQYIIYRWTFPEPHPFLSLRSFPSQWLIKTKLQKYSSTEPVWEWLPPHNCASININGGVFHETQTKYFSSNVMYNVSTTT